MTDTPPNDLPPDARETITRFRAAGQEHVFRFLDRLAPGERDSLLAQAAAVDLDLVARLASEVLDEAPRAPEIAPLEPLGPDHPDAAEARRRGHDLFRQGKVAFYTVAGGQGTRLGYDGPKGGYPVGPFSGKTLFRWHAEKVLAASRRYGRAVPWIVMVSETNEAETKRLFAAESWFGLEDRVHFVAQRMLPAVDADGKIVLRTPFELMLAPNGHGGSIDALSRDGVLDRLADAGVELLSYFQVDNPLLNPADEAFLGFQALREAEMTAKVVSKRGPEEKAGVVALVDGRPGVVEYSEITDEDAHARSADGRLVYDLANIAAHGLSVDFVRRLQGAGLPYHTAKKKVPTVDDAGDPIEVTGRKFETFVFDAIPLARGFFAWLTERAEEFSPLKNAEGEDSPESVRRDLLERTRRWYDRAGVAPPGNEEELEVSPLTAYDDETFRDWLARRGAGEKE